MIYNIDNIYWAKIIVVCVGGRGVVDWFLVKILPSQSLMVDLKATSTYCKIKILELNQ